MRGIPFKILESNPCRSLQILPSDGPPADSSEQPITGLGTVYRKEPEIMSDKLRAGAGRAERSSLPSSKRTTHGPSLYSMSYSRTPWILG